MTRILLIPVAGTIAALVMIAYAREERGTRPPEPPPVDLGDVPVHGDPGEEDDPEPPPEEPEPPAEEEPPAPKPREFQLQIEADGSILDLETREKFATLDEFAATIGEARHTLVLANGKGVPREALDEAEVRLRDRYQVRKVYRAPEAPPGEGR